MTAVASLVFPGSRALAGWWKQLAPLRPHALWVGHLLLHRVEALAAVERPADVDALAHLVLQALQLTGGSSLQTLNEQLHLGTPLLAQLLRQLRSEQLVQEDGAWSLTERGRIGIAQRQYPRMSAERQTFYFAEAEQGPSGPHFLHFAKPPPTLAWPATEGWHFEPAQLQACVRQPDDWKRRHGFPLDVQQILAAPLSDAAADTAEAWRCIILDRPERLVVALVLISPEPSAFASAGGSAAEMRLLGLAVQTEGWTLQATEPILVLESGWQEVFPELAVDPPVELWQQAWRTWCHPRGLPSQEVDACELQRQGYRLRVLATPRLVERLRAARSDVFKGEAWLLAGTGRLRTAAQVELAELKREPLARAAAENA